MRLSKFYGADIEILAGHGMTTAIDAGAKKKIIAAGPKPANDEPYR